MKFRIRMLDPYTFGDNYHVITLIDVNNDTQILTFKDEKGDIQNMTFDAFNVLLPYAHLVSNV